MTAPREYVFGYGSLADPGPRYSRSPAATGYVTDLTGWRRCWGVAMDNRVDKPGYKYYVRADGTRPGVFVAFLDLAEARGSAVNGVCREVTPEQLALLDRRERNYERREVSSAILDPPGRVWAYFGSRDGRARLAEGRATGTAVVSREYRELVERGFRALGPGQHEAFVASSDLDGLPVWDLVRVDLQPGEDGGGRTELGSSAEQRFLAAE